MQAGFKILVLKVKGVDTGFCELDLVKVRIDGGGLSLPEADEVNDVGKNFDESVMRWAEEVGEGKVGDSTLGVDRLVFLVLVRAVLEEREPEAVLTSTRSFRNDT